MKRYYSHDWFKYTSADGLICLACALFPMPAHQGSRAKLLIAEPYKNWKDAKADLSHHASLQYHQDSLVIMKNFIKTMENPAARVDNCISTEVETRVISNRKFLRTVIRAVEYCSRHGIALRGHRDDSDIFNWNFKELLLLMAESDTNLENYLKTCTSNALYISK